MQFDMQRWEYEAFVYDWGGSSLEIRRSGARRDLTWSGMWSYFNELGDIGWEMLSATSIADARWGNVDSNTTRMLFVFKRLKAAESAAVDVDARVS